MDVTPTLPPGRRGRILLITPRLPWPAHGGDRLRILRVAQAIATRHDITLLSLCQSAEELSVPPPSDSPFTEVHRVLLPKWRSWLSVLAALPDPRIALQTAYFRSAAMQRLVDRLAAGHDVVAAHLARTEAYIARLDKPSWVELTDAVSMTMSRAAGVAAGRSTLRTWLYSMEARRVQRLEHAVLQRCDLVSLISSLDKQQLIDGAAHIRAAVVVAPNGVSVPHAAPRHAGDRGRTIALLGRMDSIANRDAMWHFVRDIWPGVSSRAPNTVLHIVGHIDDADRQRLQVLSNITCHGVVPDLSTVLSHARIGVCPVRIGAGVQNKLLDYWAHGCAAITSPIGLEGLLARPGFEVEVASTDEEWIDHLVRLLHDNAAATRLATLGLQLALRSGWEAALAPLVEGVDALVQRQG